MTYELINKMSGKAIKCLRCGLTSHHPEDISKRYCSNCHIFHDEDSKPEDDDDVMGSALETAALAEAFSVDTSTPTTDTTTSTDPGFSGFDGGTSGGGGASGDF